MNATDPRYLPFLQTVFAPARQTIENARCLRRRMRKGFLSPKSLPLNAVSASPQEVGALQDLAGVMLSLGHSDPDIVLSCVNVYQSSFCVDGLDPSGCALRTHAIEGGVLAWIIAAMRVHEREVSLQGASLCAIRNLSLGQTPGDARNRQKIILAGGLEAATRVAQVHPTKDGLLIAATWLLRALLYDERHDDVSRACEAGAPASLVAAFTCHSPQISRAVSAFHRACTLIVPGYLRSGHAAPIAATLLCVSTCAA